MSLLLSSSLKEGRSSTLRFCITLDLIFLNNFGTNRQDPIYMQLDALHIHWSLWKDIDLDFNGPQFSCLACQSHLTTECEISVLKLLCFETFVQILGGYSLTLLNNRQECGYLTCSAGLLFSKAVKIILFYRCIKEGVKKK